MLPENVTQAFTIGKKTVGLKWTDTGLTYNGMAQKPTATATGLAVGDACAVTVTGEATDAGSHTAKATALSNANYALPEAVTQAFTIAPKTVGLAWTETGLTYNGAAQKPTAAATGLADGDACAVTVAGEATDAGSYKATATGLSNANYALPKNVTQAFTIAPKTVGLAWSNTSFTYDGKPHAPTATATGLAEGDACAVTVTGEATDAGSHTARAVALSNANYALPEANAQAFTIGPKPVTVKAKSASKVYGEEDPKLTAKVTGLVKGRGAGDIRYTLTREAGEDAGEYTITPSGDARQGNYTVTYQAATLTIEEKAVRRTRISFRAAGLAYDGKAKRPAVTVRVGDTVIPASEYRVVYSVRPLRYFSTDKTIAKVNKSGVITAKAKGKCTILEVTPDGISRKIRVTVKWGVGSRQ